jgi:hypothetical protein
MLDAEGFRVRILATSVKSCRKPYKPWHAHHDRRKEDVRDVCIRHIIWDPGFQLADQLPHEPSSSRYMYEDQFAIGWDQVKEVG